MAIDISAWWNPVSGDFAWLYINKVINRSITHRKGDSCHIKWHDVEHGPSHVSLLRACFPEEDCVCGCVCESGFHLAYHTQYRETSCCRHHFVGWKSHLICSVIQMESNSVYRLLALIIMPCNWHNWWCHYVKNVNDNNDDNNRNPTEMFSNEVILITTQILSYSNAGVPAVHKRVNNIWKK